MRKEYIEPEVQVVLLQYRTMLLEGSNTRTNLKEEDDLEIEEEEDPVTNGFWGR